MDNRRQAKQMLITNYLHPSSPLKTQGHTLEDNPPVKALRQNLQIKATGNYYTAHLPNSSATYGHLDIEHDDSGAWISHVETQPQAQRAGVATQLYNFAVKHQRQPIFASSAPKYEHDQFNDTRYLTGEGAAFVNGLKRNKHMPPNWHKSPYDN